MPKNMKNRKNMHCPDPALGYISPHTTFAKLKIIIKKRDMAPHPPPASSSLIPPNCLQCKVAITTPWPKTVERLETFNSLLKYTKCG